MSDSTTRYLIAADPFYTLHTTRHNDYTDGLAVGDVLIVAEGETPDRDGDIFGTTERTGRAHHVSLSVLIREDLFDKTKAAVAAGTFTIKSGVLLRLLEEAGAPSVSAKAMVALAEKESAA